MIKRLKESQHILLYAQHKERGGGERKSCQNCLRLERTKSVVCVDQPRFKWIAENTRGSALPMGDQVPSSCVVRRSIMIDPQAQIDRWAKQEPEPRKRGESELKCRGTKRVGKEKGRTRKRTSPRNYSSLEDGQAGYQARRRATEDRHARCPIEGRARWRRTRGR